MPNPADQQGHITAGLDKSGHVTPGRAHFKRVDDGADEDMPNLRRPEGGQGEPTRRSLSRLFKRQRDS